ncbi:MAG: hypothetical protein FJ190_12165 [Gammaproteobacteria bacterium]|nr:hypothetical protein [Gammaproteobacteria bacterium]
MGGFFDAPYCLVNATGDKNPKLSIRVEKFPESGGALLFHLISRLYEKTLKEHRKYTASGAMYDDPRIAVWLGVLTEL